MKIKPKRNPVPKEELRKVDERCEDRCEFCGLEIGNFFDYAHIKHRMLGGRHGEMAKIINEHRNIAKVHRMCHQIIDKLFKISNGRYLNSMNKLKQRIRWYEWAEEFGITEVK